jgi:hypothetical protein
MGLPMRRFAFLCLLALVACDKEPSSKVTVTTPDNSHLKPSLFSDYDTQPDCEKAGGEWIAWCSPSVKRCVMSWPDAGKACTDSSECASRTCMVDLVIRCDKNKQCTEPVIPATGSAAVGVCKDMDVSCGSYIEIKKGIVQEQYDID